MSLLIAIETFLIFPVVFVEMFIAPSVSVAPASSASVPSTALHKRRSFGLHSPLPNCIAVFIKGVQSLLEILGYWLSPVVKSF